MARFSLQRCTIVGIFVGIALAMPAGLVAQSITSGVVRGQVTSQGGAPMADVVVSLTPLAGGVSRTVFTARDGGFSFDYVLPGEYRVRFEQLGYRPTAVEPVPVRPARPVRLDMTLVPAPPPIGAATVLRYDRDEGTSRAGLSQGLVPLEFERLPWQRRDVGELAGFASTATESFEAEGLPGSYGAITVDGLPYAAARHPALVRDGIRHSALPVALLQSAQFVTGEADGEWSGFAGGALALATRRGRSEFAADGFGSWSGGSLNSSKFIDGPELSNTSVWGGLVLSGPVVRDTAHFVLGFEARKLDTPLPRAWQLNDETGAALIDVGSTMFNVNLAAYAQPYLLQSRTFSGFGRFDWQVGNANTLSLRAGFGTLSRPGSGGDIAAASLPIAGESGTDLFASASLTTRLLGKWPHEVRAGLSRSSREYALEDGVAAGLPSTLIVTGGQRFGLDPRLPGSFERTELTLDQAAQFGGLEHRLKLGLGASISWYDDAYDYASAGEFVFGGPTQFGQSRGAFYRSSIDGTPDLSFNVLRLTAFLQDTWNAGSGLTMIAGLGVDLESLPTTDIQANTAWQAATGLANDQISEYATIVVPRFNLVWDPAGDGSWIVTAAATRYAGTIDPAILNEVIGGDGRREVRRTAGDLGVWPNEPGTSVGARPSLTLLGPDFSGPRSDRFAFGLSTRVGGAALQFSGAYRQTEFLPRRTDLNLATSSGASDQHGRPVFGPLVQIGELVTVAQPNRRFSDFDAVYGISADGSAKYWGLTAALEHGAGEALGLFASYTYSKTTDNRPGARHGDPRSQLAPSLPAALGDWADGTSDFDLPHRLAAGIEIRPRAALRPRITATYRYRSGYPFTPGFRAGVDVNGDGSDRNDPAFIDAAAPGMSALIQSVSCLGEQAGGFVERNSCREPSVHSLNLRAGLTLARGSSTSAELFVEGINLVESTVGEPDRALYLIDPNGTLVTDQAAQRVTVPLIANPHFGEPLVRFGTGRTLRIGLQVNH